MSHAQPALEAEVKQFEDDWETGAFDNPKDVLEVVDALLDAIPPDMKDLRARVNRVAKEALENSNAPELSDEEADGVVLMMIEDAEGLLSSGDTQRAAEQAEILMSILNSEKSPTATTDEHRRRAQKILEAAQKP